MFGSSNALKYISRFYWFHKQKIVTFKHTGSKLMENQNTRRGFTQTKRKGFTLIELLVAVLIISILAAIAVPQYKKSVEKSYVPQALAILTSWAQAQDVYYLANGKYATDPKALDITLPASDKIWTISFEIHHSTNLIFVRRTSGPYQNAGFGYNLGGWNIPRRTLYCMEPWLNGKYCQKIVGGGKAVANAKEYQVFNY